MPRQPRLFNPLAMSNASFISLKRVDKTLELAKTLAEDSEHTQRLAAQLCMACHYFPRMAGQAFTDQPCACCHALQTYSTTDTDALCLPCAKEGSLCKHCGGDLGMDAGRNTWPEPKFTTSNEGNNG
jgi:hypothetical protein